jgi:hypothetical protein
VWYAWCVKQLLRGVYRAGNDTAAADIPECDRLARTIRRWENEILAYYRNDGLSNARTEAVDGLVKRIGHRFRNINNYRIRTASISSTESSGTCDPLATSGPGISRCASPPTSTSKSPRR